MSAHVYSIKNASDLASVYTLSRNKVSVRGVKERTATIIAFCIDRAPGIVRDGNAVNGIAAAVYTQRGLFVTERSAAN